MLKVIVLLTAISCLQSLSSAQSLTKPQACQKLEAGAVEILIPPKPNHPETARSGTGFIVSLDGWILTAAHVVIDEETKKYYPVVEVFLPGDPGGFERRVEKIYPGEGTSIVDFALLKVTDLPKEYSFQHRKRTLEALPLGNEAEVGIGSEVALFGSPGATGLPLQLCTFGNLSGIAQPEIYYQGVAVGGMSGGPIMSLSNGKIIGIIERRTVDIRAVHQIVKAGFCSETGLANEDKTAAENHRALCSALDLLDRQFNQGIGAGAQITAAKYALEDALRTSAQSEGKH